MDDRINNIIKNLVSWEELRQFEVNAKEKGGLTKDVAAAIHNRAAILGLALIVDKTGIDVETLTPAERKIVYVVGEYVGVMHRLGKYPGRTIPQLRNRGLIEAAENAVSRTKRTQGFETLVEADLEDLLYEQIVVDHPEEFTERALWFSRRTLGLPSESEYPPAPPDSEIQTRTNLLVRWLKEETEEAGGNIPQFTNADAARVMGMEDMSKFGRAHGQIQSRIDFACYRANLPPLGCAADAVFTGAWKSEARDWQFSVAEMQTCARGRIWEPNDFDIVLHETEKLSGKPHLLWSEAQITEPATLKAWALSFVDAASDAHAEHMGGMNQTRNAPWSRDELILALNLYLGHRDSPPGKDSDEVVELSAFLNELARVLGVAGSASYRNSNGVYMKMMNFRRFDAEYTKQGKVGLTRGNKDEAVVWAEYANDLVRLGQVCAAIRLAIGEHASDIDLNGEDEPEIQQAEEGRVLTRIHRVRERSRKLVHQAKKAAMKTHGRLFCQACGFDFTQKYGLAGEGIIDVHHTKPVHTLTEGEVTRLEDLVLLCANCHRVVHSSRRWLTVEQVSALARSGPPTLG